MVFNIERIDLFMRDDLVTIIIPIYNGKDYLNRCVSSVINQTYKNIEIILVDDGSNDGSGALCDEFTKKDKRIKVFHNKNFGVSYSRNFGMDMSCGQYIFFLDSDDYIDEEVIDNLIKNVKNYDLIKVSHKVIQNNDILKIKQYNGILENSEMIENVITGKFGGHCWGYLFKKEKILSLKFDENTSCMEDTIFLIEYLKRCRKIKYISNCYYYHEINNNSITASIDRIEKNINNYLYSLNKINTLLDNRYEKQINKRKIEIIESEISKVDSYLRLRKILSLYNNTFKSLDIRNNIYYKLFFYLLMKNNLRLLFIIIRFRRILKKKKIFYIHKIGRKNNE